MKSANRPVPALKSIRYALSGLADEERAENLRWFFKTGPGEYGEGDRFIGIRVPELRKLAKQNIEAPATVVTGLLKSPVHEERLLALLILVGRYQRGAEKEKDRIYSHYLKNTRHINNWDLVDLSAHKIVGEHLLTRDKAPLYDLAGSSSLWERRISIIATMAFLKHAEYTHSLKIAEMLVDDQEDLIHKAVGWTLREIGKLDQRVEERFLKEFYKTMPRTMLRYAIEKFPETKRQKYLKGKV